MSPEKYLTVGALTKYLKHKFEQDEHLQMVYLKGELSNFKSHTTGHFYFSIKDETSKINAIMFKANASKILFTPSDGMKVLVMGRISVYEATGNYQIYVEEMLEDGVGNLYIAFEQLKQQLLTEGLFDEVHKKPIPKYPNRIGIITAPTGAAIKDILSTLKRRYPVCETLLFPSLVQGDLAASDIVRSINLAQQHDLDVLIVGRGGGSIEDLWPFNEESVARSIFACQIPIISAVGHEIDFTIADYVADLRAPTPTGAAEMAVPNLFDLNQYFDQLQVRLKESIYKKWNYLALYLDGLTSSYVLKNPNFLYEQKQQQLDLLLERGKKQMSQLVESSIRQLKELKQHYLLSNPEQLFQPSKTLLQHKIEQLSLLNPMTIMNRGYSLVYHDGVLIKQVNRLKKEDMIQIKMQQGTIDAKIMNVKEEKHGKEKN